MSPVCCSQLPVTRSDALSCTVEQRVRGRRWRSARARALDSKEDLFMDWILHELHKAESWSKAFDISIFKGEMSQRGIDIRCARCPLVSFCEIRLKCGTLEGVGRRVQGQSGWLIPITTETNRWNINGPLRSRQQVNCTVTVASFQGRPVVTLC